MRLLLDTQALLWWVDGDERLGIEARTLILEPGNGVIVSVVSLWDIAVKVRIGTLGADISEIALAIRQDGFVLRDIGVDHLAVLMRLPSHHQDPFDHLLIAQAIAEDAVLLTADQHMGTYPVRVVGCSWSMIGSS